MSRGKRHLAIPGLETNFEARILPRILPRSLMPWLVAKISERVFDVYKPQHDKAESKP